MEHKLGNIIQLMDFVRAEDCGVIRERNVMDVVKLLGVLLFFDGHSKRCKQSAVPSKGVRSILVSRSADRGGEKRVCVFEGVEPLPGPQDASFGGEHLLFTK